LNEVAECQEQDQVFGIVIDKLQRDVGEMKGR